jgi:Family of unknown function (DUF6159)
MPTAEQMPDFVGESRIARSWRLTRASLQVVRGDRALFVLALLSTALGAMAVAVVFGLTGWIGHRHGSDASGHVALTALILAYPLTFLSVFFNTAIAAAASAALDGRRMSIGEALAVPARRLGQVALWALIATLLGVVIEQLLSRLPFGGSIAARVVGFAWSLASIFAVPVLVIEDCPATQCLQRSAKLVKERWGEGISGNVIVTAWMVLLTIPLVILFAVGLAVSYEHTAALVAVIALGALALLSIAALGAVVRQTFAVALYRYATNESAPGPFEERDLRSPFGRRRRGLFG